MSTETATPAAPEKKKRQPIPRWIVLEDGQETTFERTAETFGAAILGRKRRILVKTKTGGHRFLSEAKANEEATRARLLGDFLRASLVSEMPKIQHFVRRGNFTVKRVERKKRASKSHEEIIELF